MVEPSLLEESSSRHKFSEIPPLEYIPIMEEGKDGGEAKTRNLGPLYCSWNK
jgi:hypothetical protein